MTDNDSTRDSLQGLLKETPGTPHETKPVGSSSNHPLGIILWILAAINLIGGLVLSLTAKQTFGSCKYGRDYLCDSASDYNATVISDAVAMYGWVYGITGFIVLGSFAAILNLLSQIAANTSRIQ
jgi:hypothetical protein